MANRRFNKNGFLLLLFISVFTASLYFGGSLLANIISDETNVAYNFLMGMFILVGIAILLGIGMILMHLFDWLFPKVEDDTEDNDERR